MAQIGVEYYPISSMLMFFILRPRKKKKKLRTCEYRFQCNFKRMALLFVIVVGVDFVCLNPYFWYKWNLKHQKNKNMMPWWHLFCGLFPVKWRMAFLSELITTGKEPCFIVYLWSLFFALNYLEENLAMTFSGYFLFQFMGSEWLQIYHSPILIQNLIFPNIMNDSYFA